MSVNPYDVFPRRNLPAEAEDWGRRVEERIVDLEHGSVAQSTGLKSENRTSAATLGELSRQLNILDEQAELLEELYRAIPKTTQRIDTANSFGLGGGWNDVVSNYITVPEGAAHVNLLVVCSAQMTTGYSDRVITSGHRLALDGMAAPEFPGLFASTPGGFITSMAPSYGWSVGVTPGQVLNARLQIYPHDGSAYPPHGGSYAVISTLATFTG